MTLQADRTLVLQRCRERFNGQSVVDDRKPAVPEAPWHGVGE
jgi:hypothetical protein